MATLEDCPEANSSTCHGPEMQFLITKREDKQMEGSSVLCREAQRPMWRTAATFDNEVMMTSYIDETILCCFTRRSLLEQAIAISS